MVNGPASLSFDSLFDDIVPPTDVSQLNDSAGPPSNDADTSASPSDPLSAILQAEDGAPRHSDAAPRVTQQAYGDLDDHVSRFLGLQTTLSVPSRELVPWTGPSATADEGADPSAASVTRRKRRRLDVGVKDTIRSRVLHAIWELLDYCRRVVVEKTDKRQETYENDVVRRKCLTPVQQNMVDWLLDNGDPGAILEDVQEFIRIFWVGFSDTATHLMAGVRRLLTDYCDATSRSHALHKDDSVTASMGQRACPTCGSTSVMEQTDMSYVCEACGYLVESCAWDGITDEGIELFQEGRQYVDSGALFRHLATTTVSQHRLKTEVMQRIASVCASAGITEESHVMEVAQLLSRYAMNPISVRMRPTVAACAFLVRRRNGAAIALSEIAVRELFLFFNACRFLESCRSASNHAGQPRSPCLCGSGHR